MIHNILKGKKVILASASPRRKEIFNFLGVKILVQPANIKEPLFTNEPRKLVRFYAKQKALEVSKFMEEDCLVIAADTIVYHNKEILGKPDSDDDIRRMLTRLSNDFHHVYTGISVCYLGKTYSAVEKSKVLFSEISPTEIDEYIRTKEPFDKAGAYGIQGFGSQFIKKINGCYFNVMGFPVNKFYSLLKSIDIY